MLGPSTIHDTNFTERINVYETVFVNEITDGVATLEGGYLSNLGDPIQNSDASNKNYVDLISNIAEPIHSVQLNYLGSFASTAGLLYYQDTHTLYSSKTKVNNVVITNGYITNLQNPVLGTDGATKTYVDNFFTVGTIGSTSVSGTTYTQYQMFDNILQRSGLPNGITTDTTTNAGLLTTLAGLNVGSTLTFTLINSSGNQNSILRLVSGIGMSIVPEFIVNIYDGYVINYKMNIEANSPIPSIWKTSAVVVSTSNINLTTGGLLTINSIALSINDRVLVNAQTSIPENGIYLASTGSWTRSSDATTIIQASYNILYTPTMAWYCSSLANDGTTLKYGQSITFNQLATQPKITMYITGLSSITPYINLPQFDINFVNGERSINTTSLVTNVSEQFSFNTESKDIDIESGYTYLPTDVNFLIYRSGELDRTDILDSVANFIDETIYGSIDFLFSAGAVEFIIKNVSSVGKVVLASANGWSTDPESNMTIPAGYTGHFYLHISSLSVGSIFTIGIYKH